MRLLCYAREWLISLDVWHIWHLTKVMVRWLKFKEEYTKAIGVQGKTARFRQTCPAHPNSENCCGVQEAMLPEIKDLKHQASQSLPLSRFVWHSIFVNLRDRYPNRVQGCHTALSEISVQKTVQLLHAQRPSPRNPRKSLLSLKSCPD